MERKGSGHFGGCRANRIPQFHSQYEQNEKRNDMSQSQSFDESVGHMLNKTLGNSLNSTFYHWDQDESFLLSDLDVLKQEQLNILRHKQHHISPTQQDNTNLPLNSPDTPEKKAFINALQQQQIKLQTQQTINQQPPKNQQQQSSQQQQQCIGRTCRNPFLGSQQSGGMDSFNNNNKLCETVISEYVCEDGNSQNHTPTKEIKISSNKYLPCVLESVIQDESASNKEFSQLRNEQFSLKDKSNRKQSSSPSENLSILQILKDNELKKPISLNAMVVGAQGLGKSTFIEAFLNRKFEQEEVIRARTEEIIERRGTRREGKITLEISLVDTPGYSEEMGEFQAWMNKIIGYIRKKFQEYQENEEKQLELKSAAPTNPEKDSRIHVCFFFLNGPRIQERDLQIMLQLQEYVSIIPLLAKGDCYTSDEVKAIKAQIVKDAHDRNIQWFDCEAPLKNSPSGLAKIRHGPLGPAPPFLMISSLQKINVGNDQVQFARKYPWGICKIEDPEHSDFLLLYQLLIGYFLTDLQKLTEYHFKKFLKEEKRKHKQIKAAAKQSRKENFLAGGVLAAVGLGFLAGFFKAK